MFNIRKERIQALRQVCGESDKIVKKWKNQLKSAMCGLTALIDFDEEGISDEKIGESVNFTVSILRDDLIHHLNDFSRCYQIRTGVTVSIVGPPNSGKSTLMNLLSKNDISIISKYPGTTRDALSVNMALGGRRIVITDTAGIRNVQRCDIDEEKNDPPHERDPQGGRENDPPEGDPQGIIENEGIRRSIDCASKSAIVLLVIDPTSKKCFHNLFLHKKWQKFWQNKPIFHVMKRLYRSIFNYKSNADSDYDNQLNVDSDYDNQLNVDSDYDNQLNVDSDYDNKLNVDSDYDNQLNVDSNYVNTPNADSDYINQSQHWFLVLNKIDLISTQIKEQLINRTLISNNTLTNNPMSNGNQTLTSNQTSTSNRTLTSNPDVIVNLISCKTGEGLSELIKNITTTTNRLTESNNGILNRPRHEKCIKNVIFLLNLFLEKNKKQKNEDILINILNRAETELSKITGKISTNEMLDNIFSEFCIGK
eukprot:GHVL01034632.1.p1 GENE.GHVL01034632.1~~GHVL01034632.1.p1  ORF type:complete len:479 (+),score=113.00 GHVL01034632.1:353-1789(+)